MNTIATLLILVAPAADPRTEQGMIHYAPRETDNIPQSYRLAERRFNYSLTNTRELSISGVSVHELRFPSPVESPHPENNTVVAEYFRPAGNGPFPAVIVLEILAGGDGLARGMAQLLAQNQIAGLFVRMAYYGPRRPPNSRVRLLSPDVPQTISAIRQTVLDCRCATAWLENRPEIDGKKLGIVGTSLGSFLAALTAEMEPKLNKVAVLYGGGGFVDGYRDHPKAAPFIKLADSFKGGSDYLKKIIAPADPLTYAANLKGRDVLIVAAKRDDIVPPKMAEMLWEAAGRPKLVWFDTTHYGAALYAVPTFEAVLAHFQWR
jgi:dienelactone hydrolase